MITIHYALSDAYWQGNLPSAHRMALAVIHARQLPHSMLDRLERTIEPWLRVHAPFGGMAQDVERLIAEMREAA